MKDLSALKLNPQQEQAVRTIEGPLLIIAGAGSGKTGVITSRIAHMLNSGIPQSQILALTFTNKAAKEMAERVKTLTGKKLTNLTVSTFHAFGVRVLREKSKHLGYRPNFSIYDTTDKISCLKETAHELKLKFENNDYMNIAQEFSDIKTGRKKWDQSNKRLKELYEEYQEHMQLYNAVDFDDLITKPLELFREYPEVLQEYQKQFRYVMVDEFQDTSRIQYDFVHQIAKAHSNICCVGDDDQSIYSWRGANYGNILQFEADYPGLTEIKLERNYRSAGVILEAANSLIANNTNRKEKQLWTDQGHDTPAIMTFFPEDDTAEAEYIVSKIKRLKLQENVPYDGFGILVRTNSLTKRIENALLVNRVPYSISGGESFFQRKEIKDVISYLRVIVNPDDDISLLRIINTPRRGIGKKALQLLILTSEGERCSLFSAVSALVYAADSAISGAQRVAMSEFLELIEEYRDRFFAKKEKLSSIMKEFIADLNYWDYLLHEYQANEKVAKWRYDNILLFCDFMERWEKDPDNLDPTLGKWLNRITLITRDDASEDEGGKVSLMTIHASKGLEFDVVFLAGVEKDIIPHDRAVSEAEENIEEERRLFYVAITRARKKLFMTSCERRQKQGDAYLCQPSPFLEEIPKELLVPAEDETEVTVDEAQTILKKLPWK